MRSRRPEGGHAVARLRRGTSAVAPGGLALAHGAAASERLARSRRSWRRHLVVADAIALTTSWAVAAGVDPDLIPHGAAAPGLVLLCLLLWLGIAAGMRLHERDHGLLRNSTIDEAPYVATAVTLWCWAGLVALTVLGRDIHAPSALVLMWGVAVAGVLAGRAVVRSTVAGRSEQRAVIVGAGQVGHAVRTGIARVTKGVNVVGFVDPGARDGDAPGPWPVTPQEHPGERVLGRPEDLPRIIADQRIDRVIIAFSSDPDDVTVGLVPVLRRLGVELEIVPRLFDGLGPEIEIERLGAMPLIHVPACHASGAALRAKRLADVVLAAAGLVFLAPVLALVALVVRLDSRGPAVYASERIGRGGRPFAALKFRTMHVEHCRGGRYGGAAAEAEFARLMADPLLRREFDRSRKLMHDPRVTRVGALLRRYSLDELPQLLNVLTGELSLVGPRPVTTDEWRAYGLPDHRGQFPRGYWDVPHLRPGLTGWWQVNGRSHLDFHERTRLDLDYLANWSLKLDALILLKTLGALKNCPDEH